MKKTITTTLCILIILPVLTSCSKQKNPQDILYVTNDQGAKIAIGDTREDVEKITGSDESLVLDRLDASLQRVGYWGDYEDIQFDYMVPMERFEEEANATEDAPFDESKAQGDLVVDIRFTSRQWEFSNGITIGDTIEDVKKAYKNSDFLAQNGHKLSISYDENMNLIQFDLYSPYRVDYRFEDGVVDFINFVDNKTPNITEETFK